LKVILVFKQKKMVIDKIENYSLYVTLTERMAKGFEFINNTHLATMEPEYMKLKALFLRLFKSTNKGNKRLCTRGSC
jgi:beta-galactosidase beta subunit